MNATRFEMSSGDSWGHVMPFSSIWRCISRPDPHPRATMEDAVNVLPALGLCGVSLGVGVLWQEMQPLSVNVTSPRLALPPGPRYWISQTYATTFLISSREITGTVST